MDEAEMLAKALEAQSIDGPRAVVEVCIKRFPTSRYIKKMRVRTKQGPWGRIIALTPEGTVTEFEAHQLIRFLSFNRETVTSPISLRSRANLVQIHPFVSRHNAEKLKEISASKKLSIGAAIDDALGQYIQQFA